MGMAVRPLLLIEMKTIQSKMK